VQRLVFLGPPGAGKGTQAAALAQVLGIKHLSTGEILRSHVAAGTPLGREAEGFMTAGQLVPDRLVLAMLEAELRAPAASAGFLLDGFPRTLAQAEALDGLAPLDRVIFFDIGEGTLLERLTQRRHCPQCGLVYNLVTKPPATPGRCDQDGTPLVQRSDDREDAVRTRLRVYQEQTAPLLEFYTRQGRLRRLDANGPVEVVATRLRAALG